MKNGRWRQDIYHGEEKMKIGWGCGGHGTVVSYLEDCDMEEGKELVFDRYMDRARTIE